MKNILFLFAYLAYSCTVQAQLIFDNPSFEGDTRDYVADPPLGLPPVYFPGWTVVKSSPDIQPLWSFSDSVAVDGDTYLGLIACGSPFVWDTIGETISQELKATLIPNQPYYFDIYVRSGNNWRPTSLKTHSQIQFGLGYGNGIEQLIYRSPLLDSVWYHPTISFIPDAPYTTFYIASRNPQSQLPDSCTYSYIDLISPIYEGYPTGVENVVRDASGYNIVPNPNNGHFELRTPMMETTSQVSIYNTLGQLVFSAEQAAKSSLLSVSLEHLPQGIYYVQVSDNKNLLYSDKILVYTF